MDTEMRMSGYKRLKSTRMSVSLMCRMYVGSNAYNRPAKGNMWSTIPVALLCMIVNWSEGKQGSGPEGDDVL